MPTSAPRPEATIIRGVGAGRRRGLRNVLWCAGVSSGKYRSKDKVVHWKVKAAIQNTVSLLPDPVSYAIYYRMQRLFGGLKKTDPVDRLVAGIETWEWIARQGLDPTDKIFFEIGTGTTPLVPLAFWLMGARRTITVDVNPYLKEELVDESLEYIAVNRKEVTALFGAHLQQKRMDDLLQCARTGAFSLRRFLDLCSIQYLGLGDAAKSGLPSGSIDFHTSYTVFEHIPPMVLARILEEGNRIVRDGGLFVHKIDYGDHFSHSDATISQINFLQYSDAEWASYAGNRYMYMNRLRHDDFLALFQSAGHRILATTPALDARSLELLKTGRLRVNERFERKSPETLAIWRSWIVSQRTTSPVANGGSVLESDPQDRQA